MKSNDAVVALGALAQETRLEVFRLLVQAGRAGLPAGRIADLLELPAATLSFHLTQLRNAGLVTFQREGRSLIYAARYEAMNALLAYLTENCCQGDAGCGDAAACGPTTCNPAPARKGNARHETSARARVR
jgi:DNA-binding transcriptional ArsR family regulator